MAGVGLRLVPDERSFREVNRVLRALNPRQNRNIWNNGLSRMAALVSNNAKTKQIIRSGPKDVVDAKQLTSRTGNLRGAITVDLSQIPRLSSVIVPDIAHYGYFHEVTGVGKAKTRRPFLAPALDAMQPRFAPVMIQVIEEEIRKA